VDDKDVLLEMFKHYMSEATFHLSQRTATANILLILAGATIGFITVDPNLQGPADVSAALFLIVLGLFGIMWSIKYHERFDYFLQRARGYRDELNRSLTTDIDMKTINRIADDATERKYGPIHRMRVWRLWAALYLLIAVVGAYILYATSRLLLELVLSILLVLVIWAYIRWPDLVTRILRGSGRDL
jgi:uncharacterized membrane protein YfcA